MKLPIALSNKHIHLSQADIDVLFGQGYELTHKKDLSQPGQFACEEMVEVVGPKGSTKMRVLGPARPESQVEVSLADARGLGIAVPVRQSGDTEGTPGCKLVGPKGEVEMTKGVIVAARHIHMSLEDAERFGVKDKDVVSVQTTGERALLFNNVLVRANAAFALEMHVDLEEGNAAGVKNGDLVELVK
ncbi:MAG: phosphate propanoyltransferase [Clostridiales bacterium]|uniref:phosphate propanoyltransferase n=1 Tax=Terrisporobacter sp. TaxID=1965305 RepID=UPI002A3975A0|nr:phosphate propanoyltransferase [Terrisporobacter sp.]MCI6457952.1 phosphate propanoyltransferase [Clostridium sp.]MDD5879326.1 phosphate propanoyltransferase [Clostridiales bacterium]MCI7205521.1 phosphate propanoyltransferase [Clostridium sp.]MDD7757358.1 phosphate propanoyltransferase [Clostridiales bacterium]MDY4135400.1 phosphate propanoyltransferase [Terrisporobacter sp.]